MRLSPLSLSALVVGLSAAACSDPAGPADPIKQLPRSLTLVEQELIERSNGFGLELFRRIVAGDERPNVVLSPLSASMAQGRGHHTRTPAGYEPVPDHVAQKIRKERDAPLSA